ncbi:DUF1801 domain-containing protein [Glutamicibacter sp. NPDC087344]|uniref:DUF1801 domain-containing protein n=1 Tax=Glutamicibacter sp. NPDC087344 TaxID=3363994 RepID=UPI003809966C
MSAKDEKNLQQVIDKIDTMPEPQREIIRRAHQVILAAAPELKARIWYGMPAYALGASSPALLTLRNDDRMNLALTEKVEFRAAGGSQGGLMPAAWYFEELDAPTEQRIADIARSVVP